MLWYDYGVDKESPGGGGTPWGTDHEGMIFMAKPKVARAEQERTKMVRILQAADNRYRHELLDVEERERLRDRVILLKIRLAKLRSA
jgi:hypothetical protein